MNEKQMMVANQMTELDMIKYLVSDKHIEDIRERCQEKGRIGTGLEYAYVLGEVRAILESPIELPEVSGPGDGE